MPEKLRTLLYGVLNKKKELSDEALHHYALMLAVAVMACSVHVMFTVFFFVAGSPLLGFSHFIGVFVFMLCLRLLQKGLHGDFAGVLLSLMILFSSFATIYTIGGDNYSILYQLLVLLMQVVIPFYSRRIPRVFMVAMPFVMVGGHLLGLFHTPLQSIGVYNEILAIINILVVSTGVMLMLSLDKLVRGAVEGYRHQRMQELEEQATQDPLTGLYNRRFADQSFSRMASMSPPLSESYMAIADIDDFKSVNDTYGHEAGDETLRVLSDIFRSSLRKSDLIFRWGGEEFLLIVYNACEDDAFALLDKLRQQVENTAITSMGHTFHVTITIGMTRLRPDNISASLVACDQKLYEGKRGTKNVVVR